MSQLDDSGYRRGGKDYEGSYASKGAPRLVRHILSLRSKMRLFWEQAFERSTDIIERYSGHVFRIIASGMI